MNILLSCAGRRNYLVRFFREALSGRGQIIATDASQNAPATAEADRSFLVQRINKPGYFDSLLDICVENHVKLLVSLNDLELPGLARNAERFLAAGVRAVVSPPRVIEVCMDKIRTARFLADAGIGVPRTFASLDETRGALASGEIRFPLVVKARWGSGSIGLEFAEDEEELEIAHRFVEKKVRRSILADLADSPRADCVVVQPRVAGKEYHLDVVNDLEGRHRATLCKEKLAMRAGETDKAITLRSDRLEELGARIGRTLRHVGNLDVDVLSGPEGDFVIDLNPRFGGGYPFAQVAGANVPAALIAWAEGNNPRPEWLRVAPGVVSAKCDRLVVVAGLSAPGRIPVVTTPAMMNNTIMSINT